MPSAEQITELLQKIRGGDTAASEQLMEAVYQELRGLARHHMGSERAAHTLQPTALVNEAYVRIFKGAPITWQNRGHFFAVASRQMRRVLVDHARSTGAEKRGGDAVVVSLEDRDAPSGGQEADVVAVDLALEELARQDSRAARVVELKFFGGLTDHEVAEALEVSFAAVRRDWQFARAWLFDRLS